MKKYIKTSIPFMKVTFLVFLLLGLAATTWSLPPSPPFSLPSQTGHTGKFLTTNGSVVSWAAGGVGDVTGVGDCADGACLDGTSDGGTYIRMYDGNSHYSGIQAGDSSANLTFILPISALVAGDLLVATSANQLGVVTDVAVGQVLVSGGVGAVPAFTANPSISTINVTGTNALSLGTSRTSDGIARFKSGTALNDFYHTIQGSNFAANTTWTLPTAVPGGANYLLNVDADGTMDYTNPGTFAGLTAPVFVTSIEAPFLILGSAATAADDGAIRLPNAAYIYAEADGAGVDVSVIGVDSAEVIQIGASGASGVTIAPAITSGSITTAAGNITATSGDVTGSRVIGTSTVSSLVANVSNDTPATAPSLDFWRARAASANVADDDVLGEIRFKGQTAGGVESGAIIRAVVNGTPGSGDVPTELILATSADGSATPTTRMTINALGSVLLSTSLESPFLILGSAATAADAGAIRMANNTSIAWELAATGADVTFGVNATDDMVAALVAATDLFKITTGNLFVGAGTPTQTQDGADAYVTGILEVDGMIHADGGVTGALTGTASGNLPLAGGTLSGELIIGDGQVITFQEATAHPNDSNVVLSGDLGVLSIKTLNGGYTGQDLLIDVGSTSATIKVTATDPTDYLEVNLPTRHTNTFIFDDGVGASPLVYFYDGTDEVAYFQKLDSSYLILSTEAADGLQVLSGNLKVGGGTPGQTLNGADAYVTGLLEVDGMIHADGGVTGAFNGTVGATTPAAGTFTSVDVSRQASDATPLTKAQFATYYEDIDDGDHYRIFRMPNLTSTHVQLEPVGDPTAGQIKAYGVPADPGGGLPFVSTGTWVTPALARTEKLATFSYSGGGSAIAADTKLDAYIPAASTITGWVMLSTTSCSMVVDIWSQAYADFPPEVAQTIIQSEPPTLTTAAMGQDLSLAATWTEALAAGVTLRANVTSSDCIGNVSVTLIGTIP